MILETVRLLQEGQLEQAEYLLLEGAELRAVSSSTALCGVQCSSVMQELRLYLHACIKSRQMQPAGRESSCSHGRMAVG